MAVTTTYDLTRGPVTAVTGAAGVQTAPGATTLTDGTTAVYFIDAPTTTLYRQVIDSVTGAPVGGAVALGTNVDLPPGPNGVPHATSVDNDRLGVVAVWVESGVIRRNFYDPIFGDFTEIYETSRPGRQPDVSIIRDDIAVVWLDTQTGNIYGSINRVDEHVLFEGVHSSIQSALILQGSNFTIIVN